MKVIATHTNLGEINDDVLIVPVFEGETPLDPQSALASLDHLTRGMLETVFQSGEMSGKPDRWVLLHTANNLTIKRLLLYGAGKREALTPLSLQRTAGAAIRSLNAPGMRSAAFLLREKMSDALSLRAVVEGIVLGRFEGNLYRAKETPTTDFETLHLICEHPDVVGIESAIAEAEVLAEATNLARTLGFEPGNVMTPIELARRAEAMAAREGLAFEALGEDEMKRLGMGALLAVSRGSQEPARLIIMRYEPDRAASDELIALIGKGITFDSGGISIKPAAHMEDMKYDMGGGAAVIGAMQAIARLKPNARVIGLVPASENLPSGRAVKPGDVVRSLSGKTIEVANTDAEGRLVLADAMTYAIQQGATTLVDAATLTGACVIALGEYRAAVMSNNQALVDELIQAGEQSGERLWQMPLDKEYGDLIRSDIADVRNIGNRMAGAITAAWFLKHFAGDTAWAHLDIAGTAWTESVKPYLAKGATGFGVRLLTNFVRNRATRSSET